jgi:hypothetical protein
VSRRRIRPQEVDAGTARRILDFLNSAASAEEIAAGIELPDEPDIGPAVARHLLERRREIGRFTSLQQVTEVRQLGPVRFTQLVRALDEEDDGGGNGAPVIGGVGRAELLALKAEVAELRAVLAAIRSAVQPSAIALQAPGPERYLGQPATVVAAVSDPDGRPLEDVRVVLSTSWGRLAAADGHTLQRGRGVLVRTAADGRVQATLTPPTSEDVQLTQQRAVEAALAALDPRAESPAAVQRELAEFARAYRWEVNDELRAGVDIYFREFHAKLLDEINFRDELREWRRQDAVVLACLQPRAEDGAVEATATLVVTFKDWLGAWLQVHTELVRGDSRLSDELGLATNSKGVEDLLTRVDHRVGTFVAGHSGVVGAVVARRVAQAAVDTFLGRQVDALPIADRRKVFGTLGTASDVLVTDGRRRIADDLRTTRVAADLDQLRAEVANKVDGRVLNRKLASIRNIDDLKSGVELGREG